MSKVTIIIGLPGAGKALILRIIFQIVLFATIITKVLGLLKEANIILNRLDAKARKRFCPF